TLLTGAADRLLSTAVLNIDGGTLDLGGFAQASLGDVTLVSGALSNGSVAATSYDVRAGSISANMGGGALTKGTAGTVILTGNNSYTTTSVGAGTLQVGNGGTSGTLGAGAVVNNASLAINRSNAFNVADVSGSGNLVQDGTGTTTLSGVVSYSGSTTVNAGTLSGTIGSGALTVNSGATMALTADTSVASFTLNNGTLGGVGNTLSSTSGYALNGGTVQANLGAGTLTQASGTTVLNGSAASTSVNITGGTLTLGAAERLSNAAAVNVSSGAQLNLGGAETVGSIAGAGNIALGAATLTAGGNATSTTYSGVLSGEGGLIKQGAGTLTLAGDNTYSGTTTVSAGTLQVGDAGASGRLGSGAVVNNAALVFNRSDNHTVSNDISGSGSVTQSGTQTLSLTGTTTIGGAFASTGHWHTSQALTAGSVSSSGHATLGGNVTTTAGGQTYSGTVTTTTAVSLTATGDIVATHTGNDFTAGPLSITAHAASIDAGAHALRLGATTLAATSDIHAGGKISLEDELVLNGGTLTLTGDAAPSAGGITDGDFSGKPYNLNGLVIGQGSAAVEQTGGTITTAVGSTLNVLAPGRGSILLEQSGNAINGRLSAISGPAGDANQARFSNSGEVSKLGFVRINAAQINSTDIEGDVVKLSANSVTTPSGLIRARLPYSNLQGTLSSLPALTLVLKQPGTPNQFGAPVGPSGWLQVSVGDSTGGYVTVRPQHYGLSATAVWLGGAEPPTPFYDGAGKMTEIPIYYNGKAPSTPQAEGALSAVTTVIEDARRANFDEAVRTENVSSRLRSGVIAEVGSGRPATEGSDSIRPPASCTPTAGLACQ
ncbi:MAG: autotransporter-associated beta strand repeat-containing protein, partial [Pseudomonadota bacterium]